LTSYDSAINNNDLTFTYGVDGNRATKVSGQTTTSYTYNDAGKLVKITYPDMQREEFLYDGDGLRRKHRPKCSLLSPKQ
jgi:YD repeat-containing protein